MQLSFDSLLHQRADLFQFNITAAEHVAAMPCLAIAGHGLFAFLAIKDARRWIIAGELANHLIATIWA